MTSQHPTTTPSTLWSQSNRHSFFCSQDNDIDFPSLTALHYFRQPNKFLIIMSIACPEFHYLVMSLQTLVSVQSTWRDVGGGTASAAGEESATELTRAKGISCGATVVAG